MPRNSFALAALALLFGGVAATAQVLAPAEITDSAMRGLQEKYNEELKAIAVSINGHQFPYHFYLSRRLDLTEAQQRSSDQRSIQFDNFEGQVVLKITGNYYASYSATTMTESQRARATYMNVMLPILLDAIPRFNNQAMPQAFALEISHHVRKKVLGVTDEEPENVVLILPKAAAQRLVAAKNDAESHSAVLEGEAFLNKEPVLIWPEDERLLLTRDGKGFSSSSPVGPSAFADGHTYSSAKIVPVSSKTQPPTQAVQTAPAAPAPMAQAQSMEVPADVSRMLSRLWTHRIRQQSKKC